MPKSKSQECAPPDPRRRALGRAVGAACGLGVLGVGGIEWLRHDDAQAAGSQVLGSVGSAGIAGTTPARYSPMAKPPKLKPVHDPDFGTRMVRVTDCVADFRARVAMPAYPTTQAWNCDESLLVLYVTRETRGGRRGWALFDGQDYRFLRFIHINPSDIEQFWWSRDNPSELLYISNYSRGAVSHCEMTAFDVRRGTLRVVHDFVPDLRRMGWSEKGPVRAGYPFANGAGNRIWGLGAGGVPKIHGYLALNVFGFDLHSGRIVHYHDVPSAQPRTRVPGPRLSGRGWFWNDARSHEARFDRTWVLDLDGRVMRKIAFSAHEHVDTATNAQGQDLLVGVQFDGAIDGNLIAANLDTGEVSTLIGKANGYGYPRTGSFTSAVAYRAPQRVAGATIGSPFGTGNRHAVEHPWTLLDQEVFVTDLGTGRVLRVAHHRSTGAWGDAPHSNYWAQPNVTISPSGTRLLVQSDWGCADPAHPLIDGRAAVDTYAIELPDWHRA